MSTNPRGGNRSKRRRTVRNFDVERDDIAEESQIEGWDAGDSTAANASAETSPPAQSKAGLSPGQHAGLAAAGRVQRDRVTVLTAKRVPANNIATYEAGGVDIPVSSGDNHGARRAQVIIDASLEGPAALRGIRPTLATMNESQKRAVGVAYNAALRKC